MKQNIIFGIDVSSKFSTVCVVIDRIKQGKTFLLIKLNIFLISNTTSLLK